jgi:uncharacterized protein with PQ loop repeat
MKRKVAIFWGGEISFEAWSKYCTLCKFNTITLKKKIDNPVFYAKKNNLNLNLMFVIA